MWTLAKIALGVSAAWLAGCSSTNQSSAQPAGDVPQAVACEKCEVTWVKVPSVQKGRVVAYSTRKTMVCPDCKSAAENFFTTGKLVHTCATCGPDAMKICQTH